MTIKAIPSPLTLRPTKVNERILNELRSKVERLYDRALKIREEVKGLIDQMEELSAY